MSIKAKYIGGVFKPMESVNGLREGEEVEINIESEDFHKLAMKGGSFDFLKDEPEIYSEHDLKERFE